MKRAASYIIGIGLSLLAILPPLNYSVRAVVDPYLWLYVVIISGFFIMFLNYVRDIDILLKVGMVYIWLSCFWADALYVSLSAVILLTMAIYGLVIMQKCDFKVIIRFIEAIFWFQLTLVFLQQIDQDQLLNFGSAYHLHRDGSLVAMETHKVNYAHFLGTVRQQMRLASLVAVMAPFLLYKNRLYIIPLLIAGWLSNSAGLGLALVTWIIIHTFFVFREYFNLRKILIFSAGAAGLLLGCALWDLPSFESAWIDGRFKIWILIVKTWLFNTTGPLSTTPDMFGLTQTGPFNLESFLVGHGLDSFAYLFPIYKHDPNPFAQAHNSFLQVGWELGAIGLTLFLAYLSRIAYKLYRAEQHVLNAGLACICVNAFSAFPDRMLQSAYLILAYLALCHQKITEAEL